MSAAVYPTIPKKLSRGWRRSLRTESWYRRRHGWAAIVMVDGSGYRVVLRRTVRTFEDALASANETLNPRYE